MTTATVTSGELAHLVLEYLSSEGFSKTFKQFQKEAAGLINNTRGRRSLFTRKSFRSVLSEYCNLIELKRKREQLAAKSTLAEKLYTVLEEEEAKLLSDNEYDETKSRNLLLGNHTDRIETPTLANGTPDNQIQKGSEDASRYESSHMLHKTSRNLFGRDAGKSPQRGRKKGTPRKRPVMNSQAAYGQENRKKRAIDSPLKSNFMDLLFDGISENDVEADKLPTPILNLATGLADRINSERHTSTGEQARVELIQDKNVPMHSKSGANAELDVDNILYRISDDQDFHEIFESVFQVPTNERKHVEKDNLKATQRDIFPIEEKRATQSDGNVVGKRTQTLSEYLSKSGADIDNIISRINYN